MAGSAPYAPAGSAGPQVTTHTAATPGVGSKASRTSSVTSSRSPGVHHPALPGLRVRSTTSPAASPSARWMR